METKKHNIENFERFLREKTDEFRMYPSKRVWYSIYNDMHPGNRLPSVSMTVVLIGFLFLVGYLNTADSAKKNTVTLQSSQTAGTMAVTSAPSDENLPFYTATEENTGISSRFTADITPAVKNVPVANNNRERYNNAQKPATRKPVPLTAGNMIVTVTNSTVEEVPANTENSTASVPHNNAALFARNNVSAFNDAGTTTASNNTKEELLSSVENTSLPVEQGAEKEIFTEPVSGSSFIDRQPVEQPAAAATADITGTKAEQPAPQESKQTTALPVSNQNQVTLVDKAWIDNFALHNKPAAKKWAGKLSLQAYITPSVVYRSIKNNAVEKQLAGTNSNFNNFNANDVVKHKPSFGAEAGFSLQYDIWERIRIKAGAQFNYTRYNVFAYETNHPVAATLTMNADDNIMTYEVFRTSNYTNIYGHYSDKLHNETYQLSIPVGLDYKLANISDNVSWYAGGTLQPTIILFAKSYLLSTDRRSYVSDPTLLNRFNMNAAFETYFSFKKCGYTLQLGPQYRTQLFSTNSKMYTLEERLQNFGIKVGITKRL